MSSKSSLAAMSQSAKKKKASKPRTTVEPKSAPQLSAEFVQDSDDNSESEESESEKEAVAPESSKSLARTNGKQPAPEESSSESESESDASESSEEVPPPLEKTPEVRKSKKPAKEAPIRVASAPRPAAYKPPSGFELGSLDDEITVMDTFKEPNLSGKQIWYFTAPASVPISNLKNMSLLDVKEGNSILEYEGGKYGLKEESIDGQTSTKIMVPGESAEGYRSSSNRIDRIFHMQQLVELPGVKKAKSSTPTTYTKAPRPQPKGLRMRFHPIGFDTEKPENIGSPSASSSEESQSDTEMKDAPAPVKKNELPETKVSIDLPSSDSDDSSSSSDEGGKTLPILPTKFTSKPKPATPVPSQTTAEEGRSSLKRKHSDDRPKESKSSLSSLTHDTETLKAKKLKKKPSESQKHTVSKASASIETFKPHEDQALSSRSSKAHRSKHQSKIVESSQTSLPSENDLDFVGLPLTSSYAERTQRSTPILPPAKAKEVSAKGANTAEPSFISDEKRKKLKKSKKHRNSHSHD